MAEIFPEEPLRDIPLDHPIYHLAADVYKVDILPEQTNTTPKLRGIFVSCRVGVVFSEYGLGCGWDDFAPTAIRQAKYYDPRSARLIGLNLVSYAVGYHRLGLSHAREHTLGFGRQEKALDGFAFAQIVHDGVWNTDPGGPENLLRTLTETRTETKLERISVRPGKDSLSGIQFLYLSGLTEWSWDERALSAMRGFLNRGGTLLVDNSLGLGSFDKFARRQIKQLLPDASLQVLAPGHEVFHCLFSMEQATYTPVLKKKKPGLRTPYLEGIEIDGSLRVMYSRYDLGGGWQGTDHPLSFGYASEDALKLGANIVVYAMTH